METKHPEIRTDVACFAAYNSGTLHGRWIDATQNEGAIRDEIISMLSASPIYGAEKFAIHDHEGFEGYTISEYEGICEVCELAGFIAEQGRLGAELLSYYGDRESAQTALDDHYSVTFESVSAFAQDVIEQIQDVPENLSN